jgi:hypothetical protein
VTTNRSIFTGCFPQQLLNRYQAFIGYDCLPCPVADAIGKGIQYPPCFFEGFLFALGDEGDHHG